ncbi:MAG: hypothetical protein AB7I48_06190, partial [Planctomycetaceae bacterium]
MAPSLRASITVVLLYLAYRVYAAAVSPWTTPIAGESVAATVPRPAAPLPSDATVVAQEFLAHVPWTADAEIVLHREKEGFVYFNDSRRIEDGRQNRVRFNPFALVWFDSRRDDGVPYTVTCESAVVEFKEKFDPKLGHSEDNRIVGGHFSGNVRITGPDGLQLLGRSFDLSEGQGQYGLLRSDTNEPISFAYGPAAGKIEQVRGKAVQLDIKLAVGDDSLLGRDLPRITGIERIVLRNDVAIELVIDDDGRPMPVSIQSDGRFEYDVERMLAEFNDNVHVSRPTHRTGEPEQFDTLNCDRLSLSFEPKQRADVALVQSETERASAIQPATGPSPGPMQGHRGVDLDLQLRTLTAIGRDVVLTSDEHELHGRMGELFYNVGGRTLQMLGDELAAGAEVRFGASTLTGPDLRIRHDEQGRVRAALCAGAGQAWQTNRENGELEIESSWSERLSMAEDPASGWDLLELLGDAYVVHKQQQMGVAGDVLRVWFDSEQLQASDGRVGRETLEHGDPPKLALHRVVAEQSGAVPVVMESRRLRLESGRVEADFVAADQAHAPGGPGTSSEPFGRSAAPEESETPIFVRAGEVWASIAVDPATNKAEVSELTASTDVRVRRDATAQTATVARQNLEGSFAVECETLGLKNNAGGQVLHLLGAPAFIRTAEAEIEGRDIRIDRSQNS